MHAPVDSDADPLMRWMAIYDEPLPSRRFLKACKVFGENLWPAIVREKLGGNTYSRCVLTAFSAMAFFKGKGFEARVIPAILDVSLRGSDGPIGNTLGVGEPSVNGNSGIHVVCEIDAGESDIWIVDGAVRQIDRPSRWARPPEVIAARTFETTPPMLPGDPLAAIGFHPLAAGAIEQSPGIDLHLQWLTNPNYPDQWTGTPDADAARHGAIKKRLNAAWARLGS